MKRAWILGMVVLLLAGCETLTDKYLTRPAGEPAGAVMSAPFLDMIAGAAQPDPVVGQVYFDFDQALLTPAARRQLDGIAREVSRRPGLVIVEGHADHVNTDEYNKKLSYQRAMAVAEYLRSAGVWDERIAVHGFGEARPAASNWTDAGRVCNRGVVIKMFAQGEGMAGIEAGKVYQRMLTAKTKTAAEPRVFGILTQESSSSGAGSK
ncbi:MAG: OmpA family protein [bacterium]